MKLPAFRTVAAVLFAAAIGCDKPETARERDVPVPVIAETVVTSSVIDYVDTFGRVEARIRSDVGTVLPGRVVLMTKDVGDMIPGRSGEPSKDKAALLAELDTSILEASARRLDAEIGLAAASLSQLAKDWKRAEDLLKAGSGTEQVRDQAKAAYDVAVAKVETVKAGREEIQVKIEQSSIYAPVDAVVIKKYVNVGDVVDPMFSARLYQLECIRDLKINAVVPERDVPAVRAKKKALITFDALPGREFTGEIHTLVPSGDPVSHSFIAEIRFRNHTGEGPLPPEIPPKLTPEDLLIKPAMFARVKIIKYQKAKAASVPRRCIVEEDDDAFVYLIGADKRAHKTPVRTGVTMGLTVEVVSGLEPGQRVVGRGIENVTEGQPLRIIRGHGE
ncbi:MAG: efflux RND transporter periplasmic adaptor subunit [Planctomycetota bacterium]